jgi:hypothetical protein
MRERIIIARDGDSYKHEWLPLHLFANCHEKRFALGALTQLELIPCGLLDYFLRAIKTSAGAIGACSLLFCPGSYCLA